MGGGSPALHDLTEQSGEGEEEWGDAPKRPEHYAEGLVLTEDGAAGPSKEKETSPKGWQITSAQGMDAAWPRPPAGSVHDSPARRVRRDFAPALVICVDQ